MSEEIINPESLLEEVSFNEPPKRGRAYDADQVDSYVETLRNAVAAVDIPNLIAELESNKAELESTKETAGMLDASNTALRGQLRTFQQEIDSLNSVINKEREEVNSLTQLLEEARKETRRAPSLEITPEAFAASKIIQRATEISEQTINDAKRQVAEYLDATVKQRDDLAHEIFELKHQRLDVHNSLVSSLSTTLAQLHEQTEYFNEGIDTAPQDDSDMLSVDTPDTPPHWYNEVAATLPEDEEDVPVEEEATPSADPVDVMDVVTGTGMLDDEEDEDGEEELDFSLLRDVISRVADVADTDEDSDEDADAGEPFTPVEPLTQDQWTTDEEINQNQWTTDEEVAEEEVTAESFTDTNDTDHESEEAPLPSFDGIVSGEEEAPHQPVSVEDLTENIDYNFDDYDLDAVIDDTDASILDEDNDEKNNN